jgi:CRISPR-associated protein Csb2
LASQPLGAAAPGATRFSVAVRYLNGWAMATHPADRERAEWPPHPDRLFMALVAAAGDDTEFDDALRYVERLSSPGISASDAEQREVVTSYVPVNDATTPSTNVKIVRDCQQAATEAESVALDGKIDKQAKNAVVTPTIARMELRDRLSQIAPTANLVVALGRKIRDTSIKEFEAEALAVLPERRNRQPRTFPVAIPRDPTVHFIYEADDAFTHDLREKLAALCARVTRVGHSASLVQCWLDFDPPPANLVPTEGAAPHRLRVPSTGRLEYLRGLYELNHQQGADLRPTPGLWAGYAPPRQTQADADVARSVFDPVFLLLRPADGERRRPPLVSTLQISEALRGLLMNGAQPEDLPEALSGHAADGSRLDRPHLAIAPLPFVGYEHADGRIMGIALILPRERTEEPRSAKDVAAIGRALYRKLYGDDGFEPQALRLTMGGAGTWSLQASDDYRQVSLRPEAWTADSSDPETRGAKVWATVTPIVLDRHPKGRNGDSIAEETRDILRDACANIGLPRPVEVEFGPVSMFRGVPHVRDFPPLRRKDGSAANYMHVVIVFDRPVVGPILLGAGRYRGYGLCRPVVGAGVNA